MENEEITVEIKYSVKDFRPFLLRNQRRNIVFTAIFIFIALLSVYVVVSHFVVDTLSESFRLVALLFLFGVPLVSVFINLIALEKVARAKAKRKPFKLSADNNGISYREEFRTAAFEWNAYKLAVEYEDKFVFTNSDGGLLVPKRCFVAEDQISAFREIAKKGMGGSFRQK